METDGGSDLAQTPSPPPKPNKRKAQHSRDNSPSVTPKKKKVTANREVAHPVRKTNNKTSPMDHIDKAMERIQADEQMQHLSKNEKKKQKQKEQKDANQSGPANKPTPTPSTSKEPTSSKESRRVNGSAASPTRNSTHINITKQDSDIESDNDEFTTVRNKRKEKKERAKSNRQDNNNNNRKRVEIPPLVMEGLPSEYMVDRMINTIKLRQAFGKLNIKKAITTRLGKILIFPCTEEIRKELINKCPIKGAKCRAPVEHRGINPDNLSAVVERISPGYADDQISRELNGLSVTRLWSHNTEQRIWKVKVDFQNMKSKLGAISRGIKIGLNRYKVVDYHTKQVVQQCFKCQEFGHVSNKCKATSDTCKKCGDSGHTYKDCQNEIKECANCKGNHHSTFKGCPTYRRQCAKQDIIKLEALIRACEPKKEVKATQKALYLTSILSDLLINKCELEIEPSDIASVVTESTNHIYKSGLNWRVIAVLAHKFYKGNSQPINDTLPE
jgi:hypothetical protein